MLDDVAEGASAAPAGRAPTAKSPAARAVQVVELPQPAPQKGVAPMTIRGCQLWAGQRGSFIEPMRCALSPAPLRAAGHRATVHALLL